jgi:hypothetical protein
MNTATPTNPARQITEAFIPHPAVQGIILRIMMPSSLEMLMEEIGSVKEKIKAMDAKERQAEAMLRVLKILKQEIQNTARKKGNLKKKPQASEIDERNVETPPRKTTLSWDFVGIDKPPPEPWERTMRKRKGGYGKSEKSDEELETGDKVKILTKMFGPQDAQGREEYSYGKIVSKRGNMVKVLYEEYNVE